MAFTVEDGTGKTDANSYASVEYADAYFADRNMATWTGTSTVKQGALIQATDYIELRFADSFLGVKKVTDQALAFPRVADSFVEMPEALKRACCEYALRALGSVLLPDPYIDKTGQGLERVREKVGPIETETRYQYQGRGTVPTIIRPYPFADSLLRNLVKRGPHGVIRG